jgi:SSS family solute:Na+ symporter
MFVFIPRFWAVARHRGYVTLADFVRERFGSSTLALLVAITSLVATMPYLALQMYGIEVSLAQMGVPLEISLFIAFAILSAYTYISGLRAPALIAIAKDACIWIVVLIAVIYIPLKLGGFGNVMAAVHQKALQNPATFHDVLPPTAYSAYASLALGSALALFLYPHNLTGMFGTNSGEVLKRNAAMLPAYTFLLGLVSLLGLIAIAAGIHTSPIYGANSAIPALFIKEFPSWFAGFALGTLAIAALAPAAIMSIASANLFTRNIYREYFRPGCTEHEEARMAKHISLLVKIGALACILFLPSKLVINFQLLSNIWIIQILPAVFLGLYTNWFHRSALITGLIGGLAIGTGLVVAQSFESSVYAFHLGSIIIPLYAAIPGLVVNLLICVALTPVFSALGFAKGEDQTTSSDFAAHPVPGLLPRFRAQQALQQQALQNMQQSVGQPQGFSPMPGQPQGIAPTYARDNRMV